MSLKEAVRNGAGHPAPVCWRCGSPQEREGGKPSCLACGAIRRDTPPPVPPKPFLIIERVDALEHTVSQLAETNQRLEARLRDLAVEWRDVDVRAEAVARALVEQRLGALSDYCRKRIAELAATVDEEHRDTLRAVLRLTTRLTALEETER